MHQNVTISVDRTREILSFGRREFSYSRCGAFYGTDPGTSAEQSPPAVPVRRGGRGAKLLLVGGDAAVAELNDAVGVVGELGVVGDHQEGRARLPVDLPH